MLVNHISNRIPSWPRCSFRSAWSLLSYLICSLTFDLCNLDMLPAIFNCDSHIFNGFLLLQSWSSYLDVAVTMAAYLEPYRKNLETLLHKDGTAIDQYLLKRRLVSREFMLFLVKSLHLSCKLAINLTLYFCRSHWYFGPCILFHIWSSIALQFYWICLPNTGIHQGHWIPQ